MSGAPAGTDASRTAPPGNRSAARAPLQGQHPALAAAAHARPHRSRFGSVVRGLRSVAFFFIRGVPGTAFIIADDEVAYPSRSSWYRFYDGFKRWCIAALLFCGNSSQLLAALVAPVSTLLVIPALSQPWYRLRHGTQAPVSDPPVNLVLSAINLFTNTLANAFLLVRFSVADQHIWKVAIRISLFLWIVNLGFAIANLGVFAGGSYRNHDKYEYLEGCVLVFPSSAYPLLNSNSNQLLVCRLLLRGRRYCHISALLPLRCPLRRHGLSNSPRSSAGCRQDAQS